tara:strand:- start:863 stop:1771 length:909 start_codon:yes stop_codon:yes gene_type:complete
MTKNIEEVKLKERAIKKKDSKQKANIGKGIALIFFIAVMVDISSWDVDFELFWVFVIISLISLFYGMFQQGKVDEINLLELKEENKKLLDNLKDFNSTNKYTDDYGLLIAIDDNKDKFAFKLNNSKKITTYGYDTILSCELIEDGVSIYKKSTTRTVGGALLGGALLGGAGAIVGGLSGKQSKDKECKKIQLKLIIRDTQNPNIFLTFFDYKKVDPNSKKGIKESDMLSGGILKTSKDAANKWKDILTVIIDKTDSNVSTPFKEESVNTSVADELIKLNELKEKGILSEDEFNEQKKKFLKQ